MCRSFYESKLRPGSLVVAWRFISCSPWVAGRVLEECSIAHSIRSCPGRQTEMASRTDGNSIKDGRKSHQGWTEIASRMDGNGIKDGRKWHQGWTETASSISLPALSVCDAKEQEVRTTHTRTSARTHARTCTCARTHAHATSLRAHYGTRQPRRGRAYQHLHGAEDEEVQDIERQPCRGLV